MAFSSFFSDRLVEEAVSNPLFTNLGMARSDSASLTKSSSNLHKHSIAAAAYVYIALVCCPREQPRRLCFVRPPQAFGVFLALKGSKWGPSWRAHSFFALFFLLYLTIIQEAFFVYVCIYVRSTYYTCIWYWECMDRERLIFILRHDFSQMANMS